MPAGFGSPQGAIGAHILVKNHCNLGNTWYFPQKLPYVCVVDHNIIHLYHHKKITIYFRFFEKIDHPHFSFLAIWPHKYRNTNILVKNHYNLDQAWYFPTKTLICMYPWPQNSSIISKSLFNAKKRLPVDFPKKSITNICSCLAIWHHQY